MTTTDSADNERVRRLFADVVASSKSLVRGFLSDSTAVQLIWSQKDLVHHVAHKYQVQYHVADLTQSPPQVLVAGFPTDWTSDCTSVSPSAKRVVTLDLEDRTSERTTSEGVFRGRLLNDSGQYLL